MLWPTIVLSNIAQGSAIGVGGILSIRPQYRGTIAPCMAIAIAIPFVLICTMGKRKLAACIPLLRGTPYIFQGEELGTANAGYISIDLTLRRLLQTER